MKKLTGLELKQAISAAVIAFAVLWIDRKMRENANGNGSAT